MELFNKIAVAATVLLLASTAHARQATVEVAWGAYTPPEDKTVGAFVFYRHQYEVCRWNTPEATSGDCTFDARRRAEEYTMAVMFTDGTYTPRSSGITTAVYNRMSFKGKLLKLGTSE